MELGLVFMKIAKIDIKKIKSSLYKNIIRQIIFL
uniref:Uncharacterized protein n=1 Tax=viral metagenome TaxID=1070528 RepID=A0A6C0H8B6_9ZZZZ